MFESEKGTFVCLVGYSQNYAFQSDENWTVNEDFYFEQLRGEVNL